MNDGHEAQRRSFIRNAAAALSATVAGSAVALTPEMPTAEIQPTIEPDAQLSHRLGVLEDSDSIRKLQHIYAEHLNSRRWPSIVDLFAPDSRVHLWGGEFIGKEHGVRRLYFEHFARRVPAGAHGPVHDYLLSHRQHLDTIEVASDRCSAVARYHCLVRTEIAIHSAMPIMEMARQQGLGVRHWWEAGVFESTYVKVASTWMISRLAYRSIGPADRMLEQACAGAPTGVEFTSVYPQSPTGPDRLIQAV
jgi:hypothetical protein